MTYQLAAQNFLQFFLKLNSWKILYLHKNLMVIRVIHYFLNTYTTVSSWPYV